MASPYIRIVQSLEVFFAHSLATRAVIALILVSIAWPSNLQPTGENPKSIRGLVRAQDPKNSSSHLLISHFSFLISHVSFLISHFSFLISHFSSAG